MPTTARIEGGDGYTTRRAWIEEYFDRTAAQAWARLTSDAPVSGIRATVRAGRDRMRGILAGWLPADLTGCRVLDAGCGTGQMAMALAQRGAEVVAIDLSRTLTDLARERMAAAAIAGHVTFLAGDMLDPELGEFDHVVAMDSLIHYRSADTVRALSGLAARTRHSIVFTFAPRTPALSVMHAVGRLFPRGDRAPAIEPVAEHTLRLDLAEPPVLAGWKPSRSERVASGFYTSQAMELLAQ
jgi:magnesium-protoporphyrin O-methyltransferase